MSEFVVQDKDKQGAQGYWVLLDKARRRIRIRGRNLGRACSFTLVLASRLLYVDWLKRETFYHHKFLK